MDLSLGNTTANLIDTAGNQAAEARLERLSELSNVGRGSREDLAKAAEEFEGVFLNQLMKAMRKTVPDNKMFNSTGPTKFYQQMHDSEMAKALATGHSGMGIRELIIQQFEEYVEPNAPEQGAEEAGKMPDLFQGPSAPVALERYQSLNPVVGEVAALARLRMRASAQGQAVADTLRKYEDEIHSAARNSGLDPALVLSVVMEESGGNPQALSPKGALGLMQLMPGTALEVGLDDPSDPRQNLAGGSSYLASMLDRFDGNLEVALAAYNAGPGNVDKAGGQMPAFAETRRYVEAVQKRYAELSGGTDLAKASRKP